MNKTLRVAFPSAETGFDPQAMSDLYSATVARVIFDPLYRYDYLARPFKIIPNTAVALPDISADGTTWTIKVKPGIYFSDDPAFKGKKRELTAADYVYSWKRLADPKVRAPNIEFVHDRFVGEAEFTKAIASGANLYDVEFQGIRAIDRYTLQLKLKAPDYDLLDDLTSVHDGGGRARSRRKIRRRRSSGHGQPGRHRPVRAQGLAPRAENHARGEPELSRNVFSGKQRPRRQGHPGGDEGQAHPGDRPHRDQHPGRVESAAACVHQG